MKLFYIHGVGADPEKSRKVDAIRHLANQQDIDLVAPRFVEEWTADKMVEFGIISLLKTIKRQEDRVILIGSSRGAYIASSISRDKRCSASIASLILLSPPIGIRPDFYGSNFPVPIAPEVNVFHGYMDDLIGADQVFNFCNRNKISAHFFSDGHRLEKAREAVVLLLRKEIETLRHT